jgi:hypothetical protein
MIDAYVAEMGRSHGAAPEEAQALDVMSDAERRELLHALKTKWDAVNKQYQKMAHMVKLDTIGKMHRKEALEKELNQIESDIKKLASRGAVYVAN